MMTIKNIPKSEIIVIILEKKRRAAHSTLNLSYKTPK